MQKDEIRVTYMPLWKLLIEKNIKKSELRNMTGIAPSTFTKMSKNEHVSLDVLVRICVALKCGIDDIVCIKNEG